MKETYHLLQLTAFEMINYRKYYWQIYADFQVKSLLTLLGQRVYLVMGLQPGYTKYCCFPCLWNSRIIAKHYIKKSSPQRESFKPGEMNVQHPPVAEPHNIIPSL
ncbi:uncharacterized protein TNIN_114171 [Trichonephila inaurata madagascariensis]|uniref:Uncharacterized protein n=1 Tax=Trichonephila inaurata madagascariensis TaxID=2747483 RepID=A0A8X6YBJ8_9ARAC|nr:uncharacterized protein TNIN_114171 [Trichonephila inaurata madagascariensis]